MLVQARDVQGNWGPTSSGTFTTLDTIAPSVPGTPTFSSVTGGTATASWSAATDNVGVTGYRYSLNGGSNWTDPASSPASLTGLTVSTNYTMLVQARDAAGNWSANSSGSFTTANVYTDNLQLTIGSTGANSGGYLQGVGGALSPNTLSYGKAVTQFTSTSQVVCDPWNPFNCSVNWATYVVVSGFSANPGAGWLQSMPGFSLTGANATTFTYSNGTSTWYWPLPAMGGSGTFTWTVVHP
jgi:chitodextrinase